MKRTILSSLGAYALTICVAQNWTLVPTGFSSGFNNVFFTSANNGYVSTADGQILVTSDGAISWTQSSPPVPSSVALNGLAAIPNGGNDVVYVSGNDVNTSGTNASMLKSSNGGSSWTTQNIQHTQGFENVIHCMDANNCYLAGGQTGQGGMIARTTNGGSTWTKQTMGTAVAFFGDIAFGDVMTGYAVGLEGTPFQSGTIYKTTDGGTNWSLLTEIGSNIRAIHCFDANNCLCVDNDGDMHRTTNGTTWTTTTAVSGTVIRDIGFIDASNGYMITTDDVYRTTNGGTSWTLDPGYNGTLALGKLHVNPQAGVAHIVGPSGAMFRTTFTPVSVAEVTSEHTRFSAFPNPGVDQLTVNSDKRLERIDITDIAGRSIASYPASSSRMDLDVSHLPGGSYFIQAYAEELITTVRWIKQ